MKKCLLPFLFIFSTQFAFSLDYITRWDLSLPGAAPTSLTFGVGTVGNVNYTWETLPIGMSGAGTFTGNTATITGLPTGAVIRLKILPTNFTSMNMGYGVDRSRLVDVEQWGSVEWVTMDSAYYGCNNLNISAADIPDLSLVTTMESMFRNCSILNGPTNINSWNTSHVQDMSRVFNNAYLFNQAIGNWNTSNVTSMFMTFAYAYQFNQAIGNWNTSNVTNMMGLFTAATSFNLPIGNWNTSNVTTMHSIFAYAEQFNQPIGNWNVSSVQAMNWMFQGAIAFNQAIGNWNTSSVTSMMGLFVGATSYNQPIANWNTSLVTDMQSMFSNAIAFNQPIGNWNTSNVTNMYAMFSNASSFNQPIGNWNTSSVYEVRKMFINASSFNQSIGSWDISNFSNTSEMLNFCGMDCANYSSTLAGWSLQPNIPIGLLLDAYNLHYGTNIQNERNYLILTKGWTIVGDALNNGACCFATYYTITDTACFQYSYNGQTYTESGLFHDTLVNIGGCDSIITLNLAITNPNIAVTQSGPVLTSNAIAASYQWILCPANTSIFGATNQIFTATVNGDYAVVVTENGCVDTSNCITVSGVGITELNNKNQILLTVYPNPVAKDHLLHLNYPANTDIYKVDIVNVQGAIISVPFNPIAKTIHLPHVAKGNYMLHVSSNIGSLFSKITIE